MAEDGLQHHQENHLEEEEVTIHQEVQRVEAPKVEVRSKRRVWKMGISIEFFPFPNNFVRV